MDPRFSLLFGAPKGHKVYFWLSLADREILEKNERHPFMFMTLVISILFTLLGRAILLATIIDLKEKLCGRKPYLNIFR